jgi:hypothetical protein
VFLYASTIILYISSPFGSISTSVPNCLNPRYIAEIFVSLTLFINHSLLKYIKKKLKINLYKDGELIILNVRKDLEKASIFLKNF